MTRSALLVLVFCAWLAGGSMHATACPDTQQADVLEAVEALKLSALTGGELTPVLNAMVPRLGGRDSGRPAARMTPAAWEIFFQNTSTRVLAASGGRCVALTHNPVLAVGLVSWWTSSDGEPSPQLGLLLADERLEGREPEAPEPLWIARALETGDLRALATVSTEERVRIRRGIARSLGGLPRLSAAQLKRRHQEAVHRLLVHAEATRDALSEDRLTFLDRLARGHARFAGDSGEAPLEDLFGATGTGSLEGLRLDALVVSDAEEAYLLSPATESHRYLLVVAQPREGGERRIVLFEFVDVDEI